MPFTPQQAPANLDTDGLRKFAEEQYREIARAWTEIEAYLARTVTYTAQTLTAAQKTQSRTNIGAFGQIVMQKFPASGTWTPTPGMIFCVIECVGSGGGGGGVAGASGYGLSAGGGGAGSYSRTVASAAIVGASQVVTVNNPGAGGAAGGGSGANVGGNGGTVSVGSLCIANGGVGSSFANTSQSSAGGGGGVVGTGDLAVPGNQGQYGTYITATGLAMVCFSGQGGNSPFGAGGPPGAAATSFSPGSTGLGYGSGGSGATVANSTATAAGGAGAKGIAVITEFCA